MDQYGECVVWWSGGTGGCDAFHTISSFLKTVVNVPITGENDNFVPLILQT